jgi:hypothetical protein
MKDENRFIVQNVAWVATHPRRAAATRRAMKEHREKYPNCQLTGTDKEPKYITSYQFGIDLI